MVEALLAGVVLAILVLGVASQLAVSYQQSMILQQTATGVDLARQLTDEIASQPVSTPVATASASARSTFTGAGQYNLYADNGSSLTELSGSIVNETGSQSFTRTVSVSQSGNGVPSIDTVSPSTDFEVAKITVTTPLGQTITLYRVLTKYAFTR